ncbi:unnamed protein product [Arctogadus glacialis]
MNVALKVSVLLLSTTAVTTTTTTTTSRTAMAQPPTTRTRRFRRRCPPRIGSDSIEPASELNPSAIWNATVLKVHALCPELLCLLLSAPRSLVAPPSLFIRARSLE